MKIVASNAFIRFKKKSNKNLQLKIDEQVKIFFETPEVGELKKGDLQGIRVYNLNFKSQLYLVSYEVIEQTLHLYVIGTHENFYQRLKNLLC